ncbi:hypothetical protein A3K87_04255 [Variovorax paradoxus]|uniref:N-acetyltransferase domain-containing protein n=1 Tax=Variovorax paradoxus TaxID=34073 RepID=A0AA91I7K1_VARPD|nr:GNAT family N-acetyltransferase [Variovorax paradoxus]OAK55018.1 hypothetical protein A3K87_04255 [Variovorax paradoxus]
MTDFQAMGHDEVGAFVEAHAAEIGGDLTAAYVQAQLDSGSAVAELRPFGFAVIQQERTAQGQFIPHLLVLYVDPAERGRGVGHRFMRSLIGTYCKDYHMSLYCSGPARRRFYGRLGFVVESRDGETRLMTTNRERR